MLNETSSQTYRVNILSQDRSPMKTEKYKDGDWFHKLPLLIQIMNTILHTSWGHKPIGNRVIRKGYQYHWWRMKQAFNIFKTNDRLQKHTTGINYDLAAPNPYDSWHTLVSTQVLKSNSSKISSQLPKSLSTCN